MPRATTPRFLTLAVATLVPLLHGCSTPVERRADAGGAAGTGGDDAAGVAGTGGDAASVDAGTGAAGAIGRDGSVDRDDAAGPDATVDRGDANATDAGAAVPAVRFVGRVDRGDAKGPRFAWSGSGVVAAFSGTSVGVKLGGGQQYTVVLDGVVRPKLVPATAALTPIATGLPAGRHVIELYRRSEAEWGESQFLGFDFGAGTLLPPPPAPSRRMEVIGDSISTGFGNEGTAPCSYTIDTENHYLTWESVAARAVGAEVITTAWEGKGAVCNVGDDSGSCTTPFPKLYDRTLPARADSAWSYGLWTPEVVVINLGTNDFSSAVDPTAAQFADGYAAFLRHIRANYPAALILCTCGPMLPAGELKKVTDGIATALASVGDPRIKAFDLPIQTGATGCIGHPNVATHQKMADVLTAELQKTLGW